MQRTTIMLPRALKERAARAARARGISLGELIRQAVDHALRGASGDDLLDDRAVHDGPLPADTSERHDDVLYGARRDR